MAKKEKKPKTRYVDDGHTVYSMDGLYGDDNKKERPQLTGKERFALIRAALAHYLPIVLMVIACFVAAGLLMYIWLMH